MKHANVIVLLRRLLRAFEGRVGTASRFGLLAEMRTGRTCIWWRDYAARRQGFLGRVPNADAPAVLTVLLDGLHGMRRQGAR